jgi:hypothetical protein
MLIAAPLAAVTLVPQGSRAANQAADAPKTAQPTAPYYLASAAPTDLPSIIADGVSTSVATAVAAIAQPEIDADGETRDAALAAALSSREAADEAREAAMEAAAEAREAALEAAAEARANARDVHFSSRQDHAIKRAIEMKALGVTSEYVDAMRAAAPRLARLDAAEFTGLKAVGVTPQYARDLVSAGLRNISADELTEARAVGVTGDYVRALSAAGVRASVDDYVQLRAVGVRPDYVQGLRRSGYVYRGNPDQLVELYVMGITPSQLRGLPPAPSKPPRAPKPPKVSPPNWNPVEDPDPDPGDG